MEREFLQQIRIGDQGLPEDVIEAIWSRCQQDAQAYQQQLEQIRFEGVLNEAIGLAGGRNVRAITALLDVPALQGSQDPKNAVDRALKRLRQENGWLFHDSTVPPYAPGTGTGPVTQPEPQSLASALRERFAGEN